MAVKQNTIIDVEDKVDPTKNYQRGEEQRRQKRIAELERISKPLNELVFSEKFRIIHVIGESYPTSSGPMPPMGGSYPIHDTGFTSRLIMDVDPDDKDIAVKTLKFDGFSIVKAGDYVTAKIPRYREERVGEYFGEESTRRPPGTNRTRKFYLERAFEPVEFAIELAIFSDDGSLVRMDRAINYSSFVKD